ncbi:MAG: family 20 glycosylhydrolase, partial [Victivallales bacterium]|nr:family 20 glycosylhydrolase [Victivallales bacterium]
MMKHEQQLSRPERMSDYFGASNLKALNSCNNLNGNMREAKYFKSLFRLIVWGSLCVVAVFSSVCFATTARNARPEADAWLLPTPKESSVGVNHSFAGNTFVIDDKVSMPPATRQWLVGELKRILDWKEGSDSKNSCAIRFRRLDSAKHKEFYTLKIQSDGIEIAAANIDGSCRGIGRMLCIMESPLVEMLPEGGINCPQLAISDWPDFPLRGLHLRMNSGEAHMSLNSSRQKYYLDRMAMLGYNMVVFELGGHFESETHPECTVKPVWSKAQIRDVLDYARARGILPIPCVSSIGHLHSGPVIFPFNGPKKGKIQPIVNNIAHPDFYRIYFAMVDELVELFDKPPFFHIGCDEFDRDEGAAMLEKATGKTGHEFFAEFLNKVHAHFAAKNIKTVMWHDMLAEPGRFNRLEETNGKSTWKAIDKISRDIIINFWCYYYIDHYEFPIALKDKGFREFWVSPWDQNDNVEALCRQAYKLGATAVLGTCWWMTPHMEAIPSTAEYSWNAAAEPCKFIQIFAAFNDLFFLNRDAGGKASKVIQKDFRNFSNISSTTYPSDEFINKLKQVAPRNYIEYSGIHADISGARSFFEAGATPPSSFDASASANFASRGKFEDMRVHVPGKNKWIRLTGVNKAREQDDCIIYTPDFGKTTNTNKWGYEVAVSNVRIIADASSEGNMEIPRDGFVVSGHGKPNTDVLK